jgi:serine/threonine protein kinase
MKNTLQQIRARRISLLFMKNLFNLILLFITVTLAQDCPRKKLARSKWPFGAGLFATMYPGCLSKTDRDLIKSYEVIYYVGQNVPESSARMSFQEPLSIVPHDHLDFRYEIISALRTTENIYHLKARDHRDNTEVLLKVSRTQEGKMAIKKQYEKQNNLIKQGQADWFLKSSDGFEYRGINVVSYRAFDYRSLSSYIMQLSPSYIDSLVKNLIDLFTHIRELSLPQCEIRSDNIVLHNLGKLILTEFGSCGLPSSSEFSAPEVGSSNVDSKADVYSFGMILADIFTGGKVKQLAQQASRIKPRTDADYNTGLLKLIEQNMEPDAKDAFSGDALGFISKCLKHDPSQRLSLQELLEPHVVKQSGFRHAWPRLSPSEQILAEKFKEIYYYGQNLPPSAPRSNYAVQKLVLHDHLAFRYELTEILGAGGFGNVYKALDHKDNKEVALKVSANGQEKYLKTEYDSMMSVHRRDFGQEMNVFKKYVMKPLDWFEYRSLAVMALPLMKGDLHNDLASRSTYISYERFRTLAHRILLGMKLIEKAGFVHCDLKVQNILVSATDDPVISDFGLCENHGACCKGGICQGTMGRMAPEVCNSLPFDSKADVYSYGVMMAHIFTKNHVDGPKGYNYQDTLQTIAKNKAIKANEQEAKEAMAFISRCIQPEAVNRPSISELLNDQFFTGMRL